MALQFTKLFAPTTLALADAAIFTLQALPASSLLKNGRVRLTNTTGVAVTATLNAVPSGGAVAAGNQFFPGISIGPNDFKDVDVPELAAGDSIHGLAGAANSINIQAMDGVIFS